METEKNEAVNGNEGESGTTSEEGKDDTHRMVETDRQPGAMQYPFATHGPPPGEAEERPDRDNKNEGDKVQGTEKKLFSGALGELLGRENISAAFVLGVIILLAVLFIGVMFSSHRRKIM